MHSCYVHSLRRLLPRAGTTPDVPSPRNVVQAVSLELCAHNHWEWVLQGISSWGMALLPSAHHQCCPCSSAFRIHPQRGCVPGGLSTSEGLRLTVLPGEIKCGVEGPMRCPAVGRCRGEPALSCLHWGNCPCARAAHTVVCWDSSFA